MNSFITWMGGKKLLKSEIIKNFPPQSDYDRYIEVFGGAAWVLFDKDRHAEKEVYNDANGYLVNLFRCIKYHSEELEKEIKSRCLNSRELFYDMREQLSMKGTTDIQRAAMFYLLIRNSFAADTSSFSGNTRNILDMINYLGSIQERLKRVIIEHKDFESLIKQYDRQGALFYCDPPYQTTEKHYIHCDKFEEKDHLRLQKVLSNIQGKFVLSYNDDDFIRNLYKGFNISETQRDNNISTKSKTKRFKELIIKNY